ncbi:ABC-type multidrug transport system, ATPase and permease component [Neorhodopirellula lusitana]|uniref:ABC-type multidrug transport system, ATPase and permease component n=1 Tax=Neorhodopirellula lusitana TaxID=445327 RepID=A0ABY1Q636_9BACT|nr:ABC transporter ATP-binding protein [Neorhodopirellula lusitana]SMP56670.1 ABC-type multidrug transport system, ATPase and permease component [Neorhodopirellula lusitana]
MNRFTTLRQPRSEATKSGAGFHWLWATIAGLLVPVMLVLFGVVAELIDDGGIRTGTIRLGSYLGVPLPQGFVSQDSFTQLTQLVLVALAITVCFCLAIWLNRRTSDRLTRGVVRSLHQRMFQQSLRRAEIEGAAAQRIRAAQLIGKDLPELGMGLSLWYRVIPRSIFMLVGCIVLALMVNIWLALLAVISGAAIWKLYGRLRNPEWLELSRFEIPEIRERLINLIGDAPMMARLQAGQQADQAYEGELESLDRRLVGDDARRGRLWPVLMIAGSVAIAVLVMGLGANILSEDVRDGGLDHYGLSLPASLVLGLALTGAAFSAGRLNQLARQLRRSSRACEGIYLYLQHHDDGAPSEQRVGLAGLRESVDMQNISLKDSSGKSILNNLSLSLRPKSLVAFLGSDELSTRSLVELMMGFGRPSNGVLQIDGINLRDIHPKALAKQVMWIAPDGPLWEGTITDNLMSGLDQSVDKRDMVNVLEGLGLYERITRLSDGLDTIVGPIAESRVGRPGQNAGGNLGTPDGLSISARYTLGLARALLHRPAIVLVNEPPAPTEHLNEDPCLKAMRQLADLGSLVVVLPNRLQTMRHCDRVVLLNGANLVGEGKHAELLNSSDLYRHLNYLLFNPYRHRASN